MIQAALMHRPHKPWVDDPAVAHQEPSVGGSQNGRGLLKSTPRLNRVDRDFGGAEGPHPPQLPAYLPPRFIGSDTGAGAHLLNQFLVGRLGFLGHFL